VVGALSSILIIWVLTGWLVFEAIYRLYHPQQIQGLVMMSIACLGLIFNLIMSKILTSDDIPNAFEGHSLIAGNPGNADDIELDYGNDNNSLNQPLIEEKNNPVLRAAFVHILGDIIQSLGVVVASIIIYFYQDTHPGIQVVDPICTFVFALIVLSTSIPVSRDCLNVLMEATPAEVNIESLTKELSQVIGVVNIHDVHVWCISVGKPSISLHVLSNTPQKTLEQATRLCKKYGIFHTTIQVEDNTQKRRPSFINCTHTYDNSIH